MTEKPYTDADVERLTALVRARIGWPVSAGEAGTIVTVVLQELTAADWQPPNRNAILYVDAIVGQVTDEMVTAYKRAYAAAWKAAAPVTTQGEATSVERDAVRAGLAAVSQINVDAPQSGSCPCTCHQPDRCPCTPGTPQHHCGAGGYCTVGEPAWSHVIAFADDGTWSIEHPPACDTDRCMVTRLAQAQLPGPELRTGLVGHRFECDIADLGDVFLLGDRVDQAKD